RLGISRGTYENFVNRIVELSILKKSSYVCVANVHMCVEAYDDDEFGKAVNTADIVTPDGMPLAKAINFLYGEYQDRVAGMDLLPDLLEEAEKKGIFCFFYGGSEKMLQKSKDFITERYPNLRC